MEGPLVQHVEAGFIAVHEVQGGGIGEGLEGGSDTVDGRKGDGGFDGIEHASFDGPGAAHAPGGTDHFLDEAELDVVGGLEAVDVGGKEGLEGFAGLVIEDEAAGEESVNEGVLGRMLLADFGDGAMRGLTVRPGCENAPLGRHIYAGTG